MPLRSSNHPSYDKIFNIRNGATATIAESAVIPNHRALLVNCTGAGTLTVTNLDGTTCAIPFTTADRTLLPLQIKKYAVTSGTFEIYGLL